jgi:hypothetical protein
MFVPACAPAASVRAACAGVGPLISRRLLPHPPDRNRGRLLLQIGGHLSV